ncbi:MAG: MFS transporter [Chlamydiales bacterium]|nr:MFS transporter [Chlamydiales bacterium]
MHPLNWRKPTLIPLSNPLLPWMILSVIIFTNAAAVISAFSVMIADSSIQGELVVGDYKNMWLSLAYLLITAVTVPLSNWSADRFGYKTIFFLGAVTFFLPTFFSGFMTNYEGMITLRSLSAVGGGMIFPTSITLIDESFSKSRRTVALALYVAGAFGVGTVGGIFLGGALTEFYSWHTVFFIMGIFGPIVFIASWLLIHETQQKEMGPFDFIGTLFYLLFIWNIVVWLSNLKQPWDTEGFRAPSSELALTLGVLFFICFVWRELTTKHPLIKIHLLKSRPFVISNVAIFVIASAFFSTVSNLTMIFEDELSYSKYQTALLQIPFGIFLGLFGALSGILSSKISVRILAVIGMALTALSCFSGHSITIQSPHWQYYSVEIMRGIGIGLSLGPLTALAMKRIRMEDVGQAAVIITLFRQLGGSMGSMITGLIERVRYPFHLLRFGEQMKLSSPALQEYLRKKNDYLVENAGSIPDVFPVGSEGFGEAASIRSMDQLVEYASKQARILSINDAYYLIGWITLAILCTISFFMIRAKIRERRENIVV